MFPLSDSIGTELVKTANYKGQTLKGPKNNQIYIGNTI